MTISYMNSRFYLLFASLLLSILMITFSSGCFEGEEALEVSLEVTEIPKNQITDERPVRIGVFSMASPKTTMEFYQGFLSYLSEDNGLDFELVQRDNPAEINYLLKNRYLDAAFVRENDYMEGHGDFGMEVMAVPVIHGDLFYSSYVIVRSDGNINSLEDLHNKRFAFNAYRFNKGEIVPEYMKPVINESPESFFSSYIYSNSQDNFIDMVLQGSIEGAEVDCIMWAYIVENSADHSSNLKIIDSSHPQLVPVIAVHPDIDKELKGKIQSSLLRMHDDPEGRVVLDDMHFNMFVEMEHSTYASFGNEL